MLIDDIKIFAQNEKELETLIQMIGIYNQDKETEFEIEKCLMLMRKELKGETMKGIYLPDKEKALEHFKKKKIPSSLEY